MNRGSIDFLQFLRDFSLARWCAGFIQHRLCPQPSGGQNKGVVSSSRFAKTHASGHNNSQSAFLSSLCWSLAFCSQNCTSFHLIGGKMWPRLLAAGETVHAFSNSSSLWRSFWWCSTANKIRYSSSILDSLALCSLRHQHCLGLASGANSLAKAHQSWTRPEKVVFTFFHQAVWMKWIDFAAEFHPLKWWCDRATPEQRYNQSR